MPVDKDGNGPANDADTVQTKHEVWTVDTNEVVCDTRDKPTAERIIEALEELDART